MRRPLEGVLVVALEQAVAAPYCTARLADAGARIIKIERPTGDFARDYDHVVNGQSAYFVWLNRGKQSVVLDLKNHDDRALLHRMLLRADVFIQNLAVGAAARLGLDSAALRARNSRLITCDISGYGEDGPYRDMKAYDLLVQCEAGLASITGAPAEPGRVGVSAADICCGMNAHAAILQALYERQSTGEGAGVAVSLFDGVADWMAVPLLHYDYAGRAPQRAGLHHPSIAPYGAYTTRDGLQTIFSVQNEREWSSFCIAVLQQESLARDARFANNSLRCRNREALDAQINAVVSMLTRDEFVARLKDANIAYARLNSVAELSRHPQLRRMEVETDSGPVRMPASPLRWREAREASGAVPSLGEHTSRVRAEFSGGEAA